jgi:hypothetical protein
MMAIGLLFGIGIVTTAPLYAAAVAMVTDLQGRASKSGEGRTQELSILSDLDAGAQVQLQAGAGMTVLYLESGNEFIFKGPASIVFASAQPEVTVGAKAELRRPALGKGGRDIRIKPVGLVQGAMVMRSLRAGARLHLVNPTGPLTVDVAPEFRWQALQAGAVYSIELNDDAGATLYQTQTSETSMRLPDNVRLREGLQYSWEVSTRAADGSRVANIAKFSLAPAELRGQADAMRPEASAPISSRVIYAAWLQQMNLKDEARRYWQAVSAERPDEQRLKALAEQ